MSDVDYGRIATLLNVAEQVSKVAPQMTHISSAALREVKEINDQLKAEADELSRQTLMGSRSAPVKALLPSEPSTYVEREPGETGPIAEGEKLAVGPHGEDLVVDAEADEVPDEDPNRDGIADAPATRRRI